MQKDEDEHTYPSDSSFLLSNCVINIVGKDLTPGVPMPLSNAVKQIFPSWEKLGIDLTTLAANLIKNGCIKMISTKN